MGIYLFTKDQNYKHNLLLNQKDSRQILLNYLCASCLNKQIIIKKYLSSHLIIKIPKCNLKLFK
jgi:hypothetical protein